MTYQQTIEYLFSRLPMFSRVGAAAYKADLTNTLKLCNSIANPQNKFKSIHIAGTNGKGSTSHLLAAIMQTAGYKTGLYTSPHLKDFRERIKVDGKMCDESFVVNFIEKMKPLIEEINPSFFELTVAMAFEYFALQKIDIAIIETGLGGRLDSTNIISPELSIITNIGLDHTNLLGDTLEKIAYEKAGIIKQNTPVVIGEYLSQTKNVFINKANAAKASIFFSQDNYSIKSYSNNINNLNVVISRKDDGHEEIYSLDLTGLYQTKNLITVLESCHQLRKLGWKIDDDSIKKAVSETKKITGLMGRWQCVNEKPTVILDVGHNVDGIKQIVHQLQQTSFTNLHIVIGMVKDKDVDAVLQLLPKTATYYFTKAQIERALQEEALQALANKYSLKGSVFVDVNIALQDAKNRAIDTDLILVCGSVFLVGEVELVNGK
ncbi:MAG: bifunctional folylpolyglutamate synthase/dihydrofolate synthase [Chitinophagaceae bacterium]